MTALRMLGPRDELRALLFGDDSYRRDSAPEGELLADLAPVLPARHLRQALSIVEGASLLPDRARVAVLARSFDVGIPPDLVRIRTATLVCLPSLLRDLPVSFLDASVFAEMLDACIERPDPVEDVASVIASTNSAAAPEALLRALDRAVQQLSWARRAVGSCLSLLPQTQNTLSTMQGSLLLQNAQRLENPSECARVLAAALPRLAEPERRLAQAAAVASARAVAGGVERASALIRVADGVAEPERSRLLEEALTTARALDDRGHERGRLLTELALRMKQCATIVDEARRTFEQYLQPLDANASLTVCYARIARTLPPELRSTLAEAVQQLRSPATQLLSKSERLALAPYLSERQLAKDLVEASQSVAWLEPLVPYLTPRLLAAALEAMERDSRADRCERVAQTIGYFATFLPDELVALAAKIASALPSRWWRGRALAALWARIPESAQNEHAADAEAVSPGRLRALLSQLPPDEQDRILVRFLDELGSRTAAAATPPSTRTRREPAPSARTLESAMAEQVVNTGFAVCIDPTATLVGTTLGCGCRYWFWVDVSALREDSIEQQPTPLPDLPLGAELRVVVFGLDGQLQVARGGLGGSLHLESDGSYKVSRSASRPPGLSDAVLSRQLYFDVETPSEPGIYSLGCNLYYRQNLLQSRRVTARVTAVPEEDTTALTSEVDYAISYSLDLARLAALPEQRLSILLSDNGATHGLRFIGANEFTSETALSNEVIADCIDVAHRALHRAAWGENVPWDQSKKNYRYGGTLNRTNVRDDLIALARTGDKLATALVYTLAGTQDPRYDELRALMGAPGSVQIALKKSANHVLPAALIYDKPIDSQRDDLTLCTTFAADLEKTRPIEEGLCLQGRCPAWADKTVVCPSGFWGYRHRVGIPLSVQPETDSPIEIPYSQKIAIGMYVSTDFAVGPHEQALAAAPSLAASASSAVVHAGIEIALADTRDKTLVLLTRPQQIVYFYCHGGNTADGFPTLCVGGNKELPIAAENLKDVRWKSPQPLVILNGCHTTTFAQRAMLDFVQAFVVRSHAAGVIGTEITIFESLARPFAERCLAEFLAGVEIGEAVRRARLELLQQHHNPLGLVYIPYVSTGVRLVRVP